jgi:hypothetical protein
MNGKGAKGVSASEKTTGPEPGPPPPCGVEKVLCRLMCIASMPRSPGRTRPTIALKFAPVAINERAGRVNGFGNFDHVRLEQAAGIRFRDHDARYVRTEPRLQCLRIDAAAIRCRDALDAVTGEGCGGRIGAVGAFGNEDHFARIAPRLERGAHRQQPAKLAMRARLGAHRHAVHSGELDQPFAELW